MADLMTIGYEGAELDDFIATLRAAGVETLIDVRQAPISRRPGFSKNALRQALTDAGIGYEHLIGLGNPKPGRDAAKAGRRDEFERIFGAHMDTAHFAEHLRHAAHIALHARSCLMCYERDVAGCHRRFVADALAGELGVGQRHLRVRKGAAGDPRQGNLF